MTKLISIALLSILPFVIFVCAVTTPARGQDICATREGLAVPCAPPAQVACPVDFNQLQFVVEMIPVILKSIDNLWWNFCAVESQTCKFTGVRLVRYGAEDKWVYKTATGSIGCNSETFGDPIIGTIKHCEYTGASKIQ